tara:strand:+ start:76 stop:1311 length:1236 start_codon:yes stop_codon:yes gene_type:complete
MKRLLCLIIVLSVQNNISYGQTAENEDAVSNQISIGVRDSVFSETLGEDREIWVHVPRSSIYGFKYPVIYLLDGEFNFESVVGIVRSNAISRLIPEMIIVAIPNTNRFRDLTTSHTGDDSNPSGGAENFTKFIEDELIPHIDTNYPTTPHRTLIGHSLGGLVVANTFINHSHLFENYLAIDPSLGWDNQKLLNQGRNLLKDTDYGKKSLYIAIANTINNGDETEMTFETALKDTTSNTLHLRSIYEFSELAKSNDQITSDWNYYPNETHGTVPIVAEHHALRFFFSWFKFDHWNELYAPEPKLTGEELVELFVSHYDKISTELKHTFLPNEYEINDLAYMFLGKGDYERAFPFFELNIKNYPNSPNSYDSMGDYYIGISDTTNAIKYLSKSLKLGGVNGTKQKLEELKKGK